MKLIRSIQQMQAVSRTLRQKQQRIGFVPTMGYLHAGHLSLVAEAKKHCDVIVLSIYVNPTQFAPEEDLDSYPRDFKRDEALAKDAGVDFIFYPSDQEMYSTHHLTWVTVDELPRSLCGASRPAHFRGVTTICSKLFHAVNPHVAVFGQKDAQQAMIIKRMVEDLNFDLDIVVAPIVREPDGLAMSSRNRYLSAAERRDAVKLHEALEKAVAMIQNGEQQSAALKKIMRNHIVQSPHANIDYVEIVNAQTLQPIEKIHPPVLLALAVFMGSTRLIDNEIIMP